MAMLTIDDSTADTLREQASVGRLAGWVLRTVLDQRANPVPDDLAAGAKSGRSMTDEPLHRPSYGRALWSLQAL